MKVPSPKELLAIFQKIDPTIFMASVPQVGIISYSSRLNNFGFVVGINPETGYLNAVVSNYNIYVPNETHEMLPLDDFIQWFRERFDEWKQIPVEGRTTGRAEFEAMTIAEQEDEVPDELDLSVETMMSKRVENVVSIV